MDAITLLKHDHKTVEALFKRFEKAGDDAHVEKRAVVDKIIEELSIHAAVEEQLFYPVTRATVPETEDIALESLEEHHIVKWVLSELDGMDPEDERFDAKVTVLIENVRHHVEEEEGEYFPKVRDELGRNALNDLGDAMAAAKAVAPTHPHPRAPDTPPANIVVGTAAGVVDRVGDTVSGVAQGGVAALSDLIATVLRRKKPAARRMAPPPLAPPLPASGPRRPRPPTRSSTPPPRRSRPPRPPPERHGAPRSAPLVRRSAAPTRPPAQPRPAPRARRRRPARAPSAPDDRQASRDHREAGTARPAPAPRPRRRRRARAPSARDDRQASRDHHGSYRSQRRPDHEGRRQASPTPVGDEHLVTTGDRRRRTSRAVHRVGEAATGEWVASAVGTLVVGWLVV